jgi:bifunctional UDP-N-acetylglucosamine pyrophosphorylase/glucosamine-1-phosphate N-acetyltransferase
VGRSAIVLAAGLGTRMKSKRHKVLHHVCGKPMILHILDELDKLNLDQIIVVLGQQREQVQSVIEGRADIAYQAEQLGTGHAVQAAMASLREDAGTTVVLYGDAPLVTADTIEQLFRTQEGQGIAACVLTADVSNPTGLGRIVLGEEGRLERIVEEKDATFEEKAITLINTGIYSFHTGELIQALAQLRPDNSQGEYYLTDTLAILRRNGHAVETVQAADADEIASVNNLVQLAEVERILRERINRHWALQGVTIIDPAHTYIGTDVTISADTVIYPGSIIEVKSDIGEDCVIGPNSRIVNATLHRGVKIEQSVVIDSEIGDETTVGPFAYIRPGSRIAERVRVGDFVEIKNSVIDSDSKVSHLAYVGDAEIGQRVNIGCGVVTVNYDGKHKHKTIVGDDSFVGSNVNLIAPIHIGEGAYLSAGSTITDKVPSDGFAIARNRQVTKPNYVKAWKKVHFENEQSKGEQ